MKIKHQLIYMLFVCTLCFTSCEKEEDFSRLDTVGHESLLRTVSPSEVQESFTSSRYAKRSSEEEWLKPYFEYTDEIQLINSAEKITVTPVVASIEEAYSRLFSIEIDGELQSVVYHMFANENSTLESFNGQVFVTNTAGDIIAVFEIEDNEYTKYYNVRDSELDLSIFDVANSNTSDDGVGWEDDLPEVVIIAPPPTGNTVWIIHWLFNVPHIEESDGGGGGDSDSSSTSQTGGGSSDTNQDACLPGQIQDDNGNCIDPPEEEEEEENICDQIKDLTNDQDFKDIMQELNGLTDGDFERGYTMTKNADGSFSYSDPFNGAPNSGQVSITVNGPISGFVHNHNSGPSMLSIFSLGDIVDNLGFWHENGYIDNTDTFVFGVVTFGGTYLLSITNAGDFSTFMSDYTATQGLYNSVFNGFVNDENSSVENEIGLISFLNLNNTGLTLYKGNTDNFNQWNRAVINRNGNGTNLIQNCN